MTREQLMPIAGLMMTAGIMIGSCTWLLSNQIAGVRADSMAQTSILTAKIAADEERIAAMERLETGHYTDDVAFRAEMRAAISTVITGLADVRVSIGAHTLRDR